MTNITRIKYVKYTIAAWIVISNLERIESTSAVQRTVGFAIGIMTMINPAILQNQKYPNTTRIIV